ncbi:MAG: hypothetical protein CMN93_07920 [Synechococcus sp. CPC35]|nr:hypothetical protein [Synechococcus sp. CPC35]
MKAPPLATTQPNLLAGDALERFVDAITFQFNDLQTSRRCFLRAAWALHHHGIVRLRAVASSTQIEAINVEIRQLLDEIERGDLHRLERIAHLNLPDQRVLKGYNQFRDAEKAVINYRVKRPDGRSGSDAGMIDIFHPERLSAGLNQTIHACLQESLVQKLLQTSTFNRLRVKCRNIYLNHGVEDTRSYHCDGRSMKFKSFVYLSDVQSLADGPYCFVPGSQRRRRLWWRNARFNKRHGLGPFEFSQLKDSSAICLFACAGDMVLSSQRGAHCGHPQHPEARRAVLVNMYQR